MTKEIMGNARNISLTQCDDGGLMPIVEAIIIVSEPTFGYDESGLMRQSRKTDTVRFHTTPDRFHTTPDGLRKLAKSMNEWADDAEALAEKHGSLNGEGNDS